MLSARICSPISAPLCFALLFSVSVSLSALLCPALLHLPSPLQFHALVSSLLLCSAVVLPWAKLSVCPMPHMVAGQRGRPGVPGDQCCPGVRSRYRTRRRRSIIAWVRALRVMLAHMWHRRCHIWAGPDVCERRSSLAGPHPGEFPSRLIRGLACALSSARTACSCWWVTLPHMGGATCGRLLCIVWYDRDGASRRVT